MKKIIIPLILIVLVGTLAAFTTSTIKKEATKSEIEELVNKAYIHGAFNELNPEAMAAGFHKDFAIFSAKGEELNRYEIAAWVANVSERKSSSDFDPSKNVWDSKFAIVDFTGNSAIAKVELSKDGKHVFTDYLSLLKFDSGWKIVAKVYTRH
jgi:hypothetical protein